MQAKTIHTASIIRLYPTREQVGMLYSWQNGLRGVWNRLLDHCYKTWATAGKLPNKRARQDWLVALKKQEGMEWVANIPAHALLALNEDMHRAFANFFEKRAKKPKFRGKYGKKLSIYAVNQATHFEGNSVQLPKLGQVKYRCGTLPQGKLLSSRIYCRGNKWFMSSVFEVLAPELDIAPNPLCGLDVGSRKLAVLFDGEKHQRFDNPKAMKKHEQRLKWYQRIVSRRVKGSKRREKAKCHVARMHQRIANIRKDCAHKASTTIASQYQHIKVEDLNVKGMMANGKVAKTMADASVSAFLGYLEYKSERLGRTFEKIDRWYPSSKRCHKCHHVHVKLASDEKFACEACGFVHDRDENASINVYSYVELPQNDGQISPETLVDMGGSGFQYLGKSVPVGEARILINSGLPDQCQ